jgi:hypothetical protein
VSLFATKPLARMLVWLAIGLLVYFAYGRSHSRPRAPVAR